MIGSLAWVTTHDARGQDEDEPLALVALDRLGVRVDVVDWDDPEVDWSGFDRAVLRSPWDYAQRLPEFVGWLERVDALTELVNPVAAVRWSLDKQYLGELAADGVPITPTEFVPPGRLPELPDDPFVVKPAVGAGSRDAASYDGTQREQALAHVARLHDAGHVVLVQPLLASVAVDGEWPLVFFDGAYSHAASKRVALPRADTITELFAAESNAPYAASAEQVDVARAAVDAATRRFGRLAYARVDLVRDDAGRFCVLELELVEPSLFLPYADPAASDRLAAALADLSGR